MTDDLRSESTGPDAPINPAAHRLLSRALGRLAATLGAGLELRDDEAVLLNIPQPEGSGTEPGDSANARAIASAGADDSDDDVELLFSGYLLRVVGRDELTPNEYREVRIYRRLADVLLRGVRESAGSGGMSAGYLIEALTEILRITEQRGRLVDSYRRIIELNQKILAAENLQMVLQLILELIEDIVHADGSSLLLVDQRTGGDALYDRYGREGRNAQAHPHSGRPGHCRSRRTLGPGRVDPRRTERPAHVSASRSRS